MKLNVPGCLTGKENVKPVFFLKYRAVILNLNNETTPGLRLRLGNLMKGTTSLRLLVSLTRESSLDVTFRQLQNFLGTNSQFALQV
ncbi:unnamed protein product [Rhizophagus irregularis]|nr:unnamed protein product [Rhizophagus irregularis]